MTGPSPTATYPAGGRLTGANAPSPFDTAWGPCWIGRTREDRSHPVRRLTWIALLGLALVTSASGAPNPTRPGKLAVGVTTVDAVDTSRGNRTLPTEIWYPARHAGRDVEPLRSYPLILIAHGYCGSRL